jgi:hypothetical protein
LIAEKQSLMIMAVMSVAVKMMNPMSIIVKIWWLKFTCLCCVCVVEDVRSCDKQINCKLRFGEENIYFLMLTKQGFISPQFSSHFFFSVNKLIITPKKIKQIGY